jgi:hypothetical protein
MHPIVMFVVVIHDTGGDDFDATQLSSSFNCRCCVVSKTTQTQPPKIVKKKPISSVPTSFTNHSIQSTDTTNYAQAIIFDGRWLSKKSVSPFGFPNQQTTALPK